MAENKKLSYAIGGQAVLEGVMMRGPDNMALAVREPSGIIRIVMTPLSNTRPAICRWPIIRGMVAFVDNMLIGVRMISDSAEILGIEDEQPSKFEEMIARKTGKSAMDIMMIVAVIVAVALAGGLFIVLPSLIGQFLSRFISQGLLLNMLEGVTRLLIFLGYMTIVSAQKDIRRVYQYHGAEHKAVTCYEAGGPLTIQNARTFTTKHRRCGTNFLVLVMLISILVFTLSGWTGSWWMRILIRLLLLPVVAGIAYEVIRWVGRSDSWLARVLSTPGLWLQGLTTRQPDDDMVEVAIQALLAVLPESDPQHPHIIQVREETDESLEADSNTTPPPDMG